MAPLTIHYVPFVNSKQLRMHLIPRYFDDKALSFLFYYFFFAASDFSAVLLPDWLIAGCGSGECLWYSRSAIQTANHRLLGFSNEQSNVNRKKKKPKWQTFNSPDFHSQRTCCSKEHNTRTMASFSQTSKDCTNTTYCICEYMTKRSVVIWERCFGTVWQRY